MDGFDRLLNRNEIRRLEKAAREKDKRHLLDWISQFEITVRQLYDKEYRDEIQNSVDNFMIAVAYTLYFSEETVIKDKKDVNEFMVDLFATIDCYRTGEYKPEEFKQILEKEGIFFDNFDYFKLYKQKLDKLDKAIKTYEELANSYNKLIEEQRNNMSNSNDNKK